MKFSKFYQCCLCGYKRSVAQSDDAHLSLPQVQKRRIKRYTFYLEDDLVVIYLDTPFIITRFVKEISTAPSSSSRFHGFFSGNYVTNKNPSKKPETLEMSIQTNTLANTIWTNLAGRPHRRNSVSGKEGEKAELMGTYILIYFC